MTEAVALAERDEHLVDTSAGTTVHIVLPAFNEELCLPPLLDSIRKFMFEDRLKYKCVVVDDGSDDRTWQVVNECANRMPLHPLRHQTNGGLTDALRTGLKYVVQRSAPDDVIITMDADNTHGPGLIRRMLSRIREGNDVVIASRYRSGSRVIGVPLFRRCLSRCANLLLATCFPIKGVRDYTCGYRAYRVSFLKQAFEQYKSSFIVGEGFSCMVEVLVKLRHFSPIMTEVPLILRYDRKHGMSKMRTATTSLATLRLIIKNLLPGRG